MRLHPLIAPACALILGIVLAAWLGPWPAWPLLAAAGLAGAGLAYSGLRGRGLPVWLLAALCLLLGAGLLSAERARTLPPEHLARLADGRTHALVADVYGAPEPTTRNPRLLLEARSLDGRPARGLLRLSLGPSLALPPVGSRVSLRLRLSPISNLANPGGFDYAAYMAAQGIWARAYAGQAAGLTVQGPGSLPWPRLPVQRARARLGGLLDRLPPGQGRELLRALLLGQRGGLNNHTREAFSATGTAHLIAISGLHIGLVWGLAFLLLRLALTLWPRLALAWPAPKLAALGALMPAAAYAALAGGSAPTLRALIMIACLAAALWVGRPYRPAGGLALAALVIGLIWPEAPLTVSFQLSFVAVAAILLAAGPLARWLQRTGPGWRWLGGLAGWLAVSAVVGLAVWPLSVLSFHQLPVYSLPANALLIPLVAMFTLPLALLAAGLGLLWPAGGLWLLGLAWWPAAGAVALAGWLAALPGALHYLAGPGPLAAALIYAAALAGLALKGAWRWALAGPLAAAALLAALVQAAPPAADGRLTAWVLDVGQGSAAVVRLPQGQVLVIDGGGWPGSDFDFGRGVLAPFFWSQGLPRPTAVACSHADADHAGGLSFLVRWLRPKALWTNGAPAAGGWYGRLLAAARERRVPVLTPATLLAEWELGGARLRLAWPRPGAATAGRSQNDLSLWLGLGLGETWLWLPGDAGPAVEREVAPALPAAGRQVLLAPHHGGKGSCTQELLARLRPQAVVFSAGCGGRYATPRPEVLARVLASGARAYSTASGGCLTLVSDGRDWSIRPYLDPPRSCGAALLRPAAPR
ncbi:MAG: DNA internalization-related competence protein ComEC/Rec2 [Desulfarculus sp.]|nr:MAG: DNA internalization-related competence protein ComEC/Rec2 [Desulfarculus sp.]